MLLFGIVSQVTPPPLPSLSPFVSSPFLNFFSHLFSLCAGQVIKMITTQGDVFSLSFGGNSIWMGTTDGIVVYDKVVIPLFFLKFITSSILQFYNFTV